MLFFGQFQFLETIFLFLLKIYFNIQSNQLNGNCNRTAIDTFLFILSVELQIVPVFYCMGIHIQSNFLGFGIGRSPQYGICTQRH